LYSSALSLIVFAGLLVLARRNPRTGVLFWSFLLMDSAARILLGFVRYSESGNRAFELAGLSVSVNQVVAAVLAGVSLAVIARLRSSRAR
jgi:prolipoprotein diacylglyceryltransferase